MPWHLSSRISMPLHYYSHGYLFRSYFHFLNSSFFFFFVRIYFSKMFWLITFRGDFYRRNGISFTVPTTHIFKYLNAWNDINWANSVLNEIGFSFVSKWTAIQNTIGKFLYHFIDSNINKSVSDIIAAILLLSIDLNRFFVSLSLFSLRVFFFSLILDDVNNYNSH